MIKKKVMVFLIILIIVCIYGIHFYKYINNKIRIEIRGTELNHSYLKLYEISNEKIVYTTFDKIVYINGKNEYDLVDALNENKININQILSKNNDFDSLNDGGTKIYHFDSKNNKFTNKSFDVVACNTLDGVKDIYIISEFDYTNSVCTKK